MLWLPLALSDGEFQVNDSTALPENGNVILALDGGRRDEMCMVFWRARHWLSLITTNVATTLSSEQL